MLREMCSRYVETTNKLKTELTHVNRTVDTVIRRNRNLMTKNQGLRAELREVRIIMVQMTEGLAPGDWDRPKRIRPTPRDTSPFRNVWTAN